MIAASHRHPQLSPILRFSTALIYWRGGHVSKPELMLTNVRARSGPPRAWQCPSFSFAGLSPIRGYLNNFVSPNYSPASACTIRFFFRVSFPVCSSSTVPVNTRRTRQEEFCSASTRPRSRETLLLVPSSMRSPAEFVNLVTRNGRPRECIL